MSLPNAILLLLTISKSAVVTIYGENGSLQESQTLQGKLTDSLYAAVKDLESRYNITQVAYAKGPGSFMGLKLGYIFLQTYSSVKHIPFVAASSFIFADEIHSNGNRWFVKRGNEIDLITKNSTINPIVAPTQIDLACFDGAVEPNYILPAV